ncbi:DUF6029 family protein [Aurantibacillus circumpalustris]|uniref:DUF6029 family protein n=1 Tax=Aurantibacillus circumpalustris TaxID=3036359 RepID=UPI00295B7128|nr:DUF6029 family protein [Aurantibacillus circumpalustris]
MLKKHNRSSLTATFLILLFLATYQYQAQTDMGSVHGNFQIDAQYYNPDSLIGAPKVPEKMLSNAFGNINYQRGKFSAGVRYEAYNNVMQGFDSRYKGQGIANRFARYQDQLLDITVGNIYEQFGSGLLFRTYYEPGLLYDNSLDGIRVISNPFKGITLKALAGKQRSFFTVGPGIVRGIDGEVNINDLFDSLLANLKTKVIIGGSFVSKNQVDADPDFNLPENVGSYGGRINIIRGGFSFFGEYVQKENDPSASNYAFVEGEKYYSYKQGEAAFVSASYATRGISFLLQGKRVDNMSFRSDRDATLQNLLINYLPATTRQHTYLMPAYSPYATQPNGEVGGMAEVQFNFKKGSRIGGKYGMDITINYSQASGLKKIGVSDSTTTSKLYKTKYSEIGDLYYSDFFVEVNKKFSKKFKGTFMYCKQFYDKNIIQFGSPFAGYNNISSHIGVIDLTYKYKNNSALRLEVQGLFRDNKDTLNLGSWASALIEWSPSTNWFIAVLDQYNYGNPVNQLKLHYFLITAGYTKGPHRISMSYGKQRAGIFCVGGVCRNVPASNGLAISITSSF